MLGKLRKNVGCFLFAAVLGLLAAPSFVSAKPLNTYLESVKMARSEISAFVNKETDLADETTAKTANLVLRQIAVRLNEYTEIEHRGVFIPVDNRWIRKSQVSFEKEEDPEKKKLIIRSIGETLESIEAKALALKSAGKRGITKDEEKQKLSNILKREEFNPAAAQTESPAARVYRMITEWLRSLFPQIEPVTPQNSSDLGLLRGFLQVLILGVVAALLLYLLVKFGPRLLRKAGSREGVGKSQLILGEEIRADATTEDLFAEAEVLARNGDIRGAIRKGYISLLFELSQRKLIRLAKYRTNRDYLSDLTKNKKLRADVNDLTLNYERHWYGRKLAEAGEWEEFKQGYREAMKRG